MQEENIPKTENFPPAISQSKIWLSAPHMGGREQSFVQEAFDSNWVAPIGPNVTGFEEDIINYANCGHAVALSSGTAAIHLALVMLDVRPGDFVICQSFTFSASANPIGYLGAIPVFVDSEPETWNLCPQALEDAVKACINGKWGERKLPKAIVYVDLYGMPARVETISEVAGRFGIPLIEDAAEALGSRFKGNKCGTFGKIGIYSFNGNKIITTSGGGALVSKSEKYVEKARVLAMQAREDAPHYEHKELGYNYRMSNICAGIGRGQMEVLDLRVQQRRAIYEKYKAALGRYPGIQFLEEPEGAFSNRWLSAVVVKPELSDGKCREDIRLALAKDNIESRPLWKPLHLQPVFEAMPYMGGTLASDLFRDGLCLPSGSNLGTDDLDRIITIVKDVLEETKL